MNFDADVAVFSFVCYNVREVFQKGMEEESYEICNSVSGRISGRLFRAGETTA